MLLNESTGSEHGIDVLAERLDRIEATLAVLVQQRTVKEWYTTTEIGNILGRAEYTVREWCRMGRIRAQKLRGGRGNEGEWRISREELERYHRDGLRPIPREY